MRLRRQLQSGRTEAETAGFDGCLGIHSARAGDVEAKVLFVVNRAKGLYNLVCLRQGKGHPNAEQSVPIRPKASPRVTTAVQDVRGL